MKHHDAENAAKLEVLQKAARVGFDALDRGEFKQFESSYELEAYLNELSQRLIATQ